MTHARAIPLTPLELDYMRSRLIEASKDLAALVVGKPPEYVFDGRANERKLCQLQWQFEEQRALFITTKSATRLRELARELPKIAGLLRRAATGWRDPRGVVRRFALDNPELTADRMRAELEGAV